MPQKPKVNITVLVSTTILLSLTLTSLADNPQPISDNSLASDHCLTERETLTDNWFGFGQELSSIGLTVNLGATQIYQLNLHGGLSTHRRSGRYSGSYDLELEFDLANTLSLDGGTFYIAAEGSFSDGLDTSSIGSVFGINADAGGYRSLDVTEVYYEQALFDETLRIRIGKLDLTGGFECRGCPVSFDANSYANDETSQFLNGALINNPTIPFPEPGLGIVLHLEPAQWCYVSAGIADAQADARETGFNTTFNGDHYFFAVFEAGVVPQLPSNQGPLQGAYRLGLWFDPQPKDRNDGNGSETDDLGFYLSCDQALIRETDQPDDSQGLSAFFRLGFADDDVNPVDSFYSLGAQYQGAIPTRDDDTLALGLARGKLVRSAGFTESHETAVELCYNAVITPWCTVSPSAQYILNPGGNSTGSDAFVLGCRVQITF